LQVPPILNKKLNILDREVLVSVKQLLAYTSCPITSHRNSTAGHVAGVRFLASKTTRQRKAKLKSVSGIIRSPAIVTTFPS
jgi:hypothetical protein